jgi:hypothetical protein
MIGLGSLCLAALAVSGCSGDIGEPWVSGQQAEALADERSMSADQKRELTHRLQRYAAAYR